MLKDYRNESIAFALAAGIAPIGSIDELHADIEKEARRARYHRRKGRK